jgi:hypothetical protein
MARPTRFTAERRERFLLALTAGSFPEPAARLAGWSPASMYRYLRLTTSAAVAFRHEVLRVETEVELRLVGTLTQAAYRDPRLAMAFLERRFPERWGRKASVAPPLEALEVTKPAAQSADVSSMVMLDPEDAQELVSRILARSREQRALAEPAVVVVEEAPRRPLSVALKDLRVDAADEDEE